MTENRLAPLENAFPRRTRPLLMVGLVAGDPFLDATKDYMDAVVAGGADVIELLVPFSDPTYHGAVMRRSCRRAMRERVSWDAIEKLVADFRSGDQETPVVISSYFNRVLARGEERCVQGLSEAGADAVMITDLPAEEAEDFRRQAQESKLALIQTVAATTSKQRFRKLAKQARGLMVWTGHFASDLQVDDSDVQDRIRDLRQYTSLPMVASMNVETGEEAATVAQAAHGVLVGSSVAWLIEGKGPNVEERLESFVGNLRQHLDEPDES